MKSRGPLGPSTLPPVFVPFARDVRVHLGVVALGTPPRLGTCLAALAAHESRHDFAVSCLVNRDTLRPQPLSVEVPDGVRVERPLANVGWSGGLHLLRELSDAELFVWVQDDMLPEPGWLDALVDAADSHPSVGLFGALRVSDDGEVLLYNGGAAQPPDQVALWNDADTTAAVTPTDVTRLDWVTSKGCLTRTRVFDEVGGPDPRLWPLNHVDKDYATHVRCHGYDVALVPAARLRHAGSQSAPSSFRMFLNAWRDGWFDERWADAVTALAGRTSGIVDHPCAEWREDEVSLVEAVSAREASAMIVAFARDRATHLAELTQQHEVEVAALGERAARLEQQLDETEARLARVRRRVRRLRRRLADAEPAHSLRGRLSERLRQLR